MLLALSATVIVIVVLLWEVFMPRIEEFLERRRSRRAEGAWRRSGARRRAWSASGGRGFAIIRRVKFLRMKPGHGEVLIAEGDPEVTEEEQALVEAFRAQLDAGMWAAVPVQGTAGRRQAQMVKRFEDVPRDADRVIFFPRAAGGR